MPKGLPDARGVKLAARVAFAAMAVALLAGGYLYYRSEADRIRQEKYQGIRAVAALKAGEIVRWSQHRAFEIDRIAKSPILRRAIETLVREPANQGARAEMQEPLKLELENDAHADALLVSPEGKVLLSARDDPDPIDPATKQAIATSLASHAAVLADLYRCPKGIIHADVVEMMLDAQGRPLVVVVLRSDVKAFLYPLIQSWPTPSASAETLLVRRVGDEVVYLTELRHQLNTALSLRIPLTRADLPAVQAVLGKQGLFDGKDYRGVDVLADLRPIPGSDWFMVAKVDADEILAEAHYRAKMIALFVVLGVLLAGIATTLASRQRREKLLHDLYESERSRREAEGELRTTFYSIGDAIITTDRAGQIRQMNPVAQRLTGWTETDARGKPLGSVFCIVNEETRAKVESPVERVLREGQVVGLANHTMLIAKNGAEHPIADSGAPIRDEKGEVTGVVLVFRDQTEERAAQKAIEEAEARFRGFFDDAPIGKSMTSPEGILKRVNPAFCKMLGRSAEELATISTLSLTHPDDVEMTRECFRSLIAGERDSWVMDKRFFTKDGRLVWTHVTTRLSRDAQGRPLHLVTHIEDITARKQAEEALRLSEERNRATLQSIGDGVISTEASGRVSQINPVAQALTGWTEAQALGQPLDAVFRIVNEETRAKVESPVERVLREGKVVGLANHAILIAKDGAAHPIADSGAPIHDAHGAITGVVLVFRDQTKERHEEAVLRASEERFRALFDRSPDAYLLVAEGKITACNDATLRMLRAEPGQVIGLSPDALAPELQPDGVPSAGQAAIRVAQTLAHGNARFEFQHRRFDGTLFWADVACVPVDLGGGKGLFASWRDITERKQAEAALRASEERYRSLTEQASDGIFITDAAGKYAEVNRGACSMLGYSREELLGKTISDLIAPEDMTAAPVRFDDLRQGRTVLTERRLVRKDGSQVSVELSARMLADGRFHAIARDITERLRALESLRASEERFRKLFKLAPVPMSQLSNDGATFINDRFTQTFGYSQADIPTVEGWWLAAYPDEPYRRTILETREAAFTRASTSGKEFEPIESRVTCKDGQVRVVEISGIGLENGQLSVFHDITDRRLAEERYRYLFENMLNGFAYCKMIYEGDRPVDFIYLAVNDKFAALTGLKDVAGRPASEVIPGIRETDTELLEFYGRVARSGAPEHIDRYVVALDMWFSISVYSPSRDHFVAVFDVITDRKKAEAAVKESEEKFRTIFESNSAAMAIIERDTTISMVNREYCKLGRFSPEDVVGTSWTSQIVPEDLERLKDYNRRRLTDPASVPDQYEFKFRRKDGGICDALMSVAVIPASGKIVCSFVDITERKRADEALQESEAKFSTAFRASPVAMALTALVDGRLGDVNQEFCRLFEYPREELVGHTTTELGVFSDPADRQRLIDAVKRDDQVQAMPFVFRRRSGSLFDCLVSSCVTTLAGERLLLSSMVDITERKRAEVALRMSSALIRAVIEGTTNLICVKDHEGKIILANAAQLRFLGKAASDVIGRSDLELVADAQQAATILENDRRIMSSGHSEVVEESGVGPAGQWNYLFTKSPYSDPDGQVIGVIGVGTDITERKRADEAMRASEEKYRSLHESMMDAFVSVALDGPILEFNHAYQEMLGYSPDELRKVRYQDLTPEKWREVESKIVQEQVMKRGYSDVYEKEYRRKDGTVFPVELRAFLLRDAAGQPVSIWGIARDITERKRMESELHKAIDELNRSNKDLEQFAYVASHDLQEPLRMVSSYTQLLAQKYQGQLDDKAKMYIGYAVDGAVRMQRLINDLLTYSRVSTRGKPPELTDSHAVLGEVLRNLQVAIQESRAVVTNEDLPTVIVDSGQLLQVLQNLVANAVKFHGADSPHVHITAKDLGHEWQFSVKDNGIGIEAQYAKRLFVIFQRLHTRQEYPGTGIGLALCKRIVERHDGKIWFESEFGKGSTFFFTIPKQQARGA